MTLQAVIDPKRNKLATATTIATTTIITTTKTTTTSTKNSERSHKAESEMVKRNSNLHFTSAKCVFSL